MTDPVAVDKAEAALKPRSRFAFLLRPAVLITLTVLTVLVAIPLGYRSSRLAGIPPIDEVVDLETAGRIEITPEQNAFTFYERAWTLIPLGLDVDPAGEAVELLKTEDWDAVSLEARDVLDQCEEMLAEWKRGTKFDRGVRVQPADLNWRVRFDSTNSKMVCRLAVLRSARALHEGRPEEAWRWLRAVLRFSRHYGHPGVLYDQLLSVSFHEMACQSIVRWSVHRDVSSAQLESALIEVRDIFRLTARESERLKTSYVVTMKVLSSRESLCEYAGDFPGTIGVPEQLHGTYFFVVAEPEVCRMLNRHWYANLLSQCDLPRWERSLASSRTGLFQPTGAERPELIDPAVLSDLSQRSPLANLLFPSVSFCEYGDSEQVRQTALELCLAAELFRRRHGRHPESLDALVPDFIDEIPRDVYGSGPTDRMLMISREAEPLDEASEETPPPPGLIIYSRGLDGSDDAGNIEGLMDVGLRIPLPQSEAKAK